ncbi:MAG TPA: chromosomal replication initiator protein DnaA [bacterium]|nr:chromosomal replication initiator protein DnaA [bacterium]
MWKKIVAELKNTNSEGIINTFISPLFVIKESREEIIIGCPSEQILHVLEKNGWVDQIRDLVTHLFNETSINFVIRSADIDSGIQPSLPFIKEQAPVDRDERKDVSLSVDYTFDNFVSGPSNQTAFAAAQGIAKNPGVHYNPFFIYGDSGLGKTHIIQAIGNYILKNKSKSVYYTSFNQLMIEYVAALSSNTVAKFRSRILENDVLLIDDIQFLSKKMGTQIEFFNIFNSFYESGKQIVLTSDRYISEIKDIDDRLRSRFVMGVILEIKPPEYETRLAIVKKKSELYKINIDEETARLIASSLKNNVREIEGALRTLQISSELMGINKIYRSFAEDILKDMLKKKGGLGIDEIIKLTSTCLHVKPSEIISSKRSKLISLSRQISMYLIKKYTSKTLKEIGDGFGGRNHATVLSSISKIEQVILEDMNIKKIIDKIEREIEESKGSF